MSAPTLDPVRAYRDSMKRSRLIYLAVIAVILLAVGVVFSIAYARGEVNNSRLVTAATPPTALPQAPVAATVSPRWTTTDVAASGTPYSGGTVVTHTAHQINGRSATTGSLTWFYRRSTRTLCDVVQAADQTFAIWQVKGNCDQLTAQNSQTGALQWTRTLSMDGHPVDGHPAVSYAASTLMIATPQVIYSIATGDAKQGLNRWRFHRDGCTVNRAVMGDAGALISLSCTGQKCEAQAQFCANGDLLVLREPYTSDDNNDKKNPDKIKWMLKGSKLVPLSSDSQVLASDPVTDRVLVLADKGAKTATVAISGVDDNTRTQPVGSTELIWAAGTTYAVQGSTIMWKARTSGLPTVTDLDAADADLANTSTVLAVPSASGADLLTAATGRISRTVTLPTPKSDARVFPYGGGLIVTGTNGAVFYR
jgi:hypothetical protein